MPASHTESSKLLSILFQISHYPKTDLTRILQSKLTRSLHVNFQKQKIIAIA